MQLNKTLFPSIIAVRSDLSEVRLGAAMAENCYARSMANAYDQRVILWLVIGPPGCVVFHTSVSLGYLRVRTSLLAPRSTFDV
jgi:hypothetical protein